EVPWLETASVEKGYGEDDLRHCSRDPQIDRWALRQYRSLQGWLVRAI
ncbi:MAG: hypothetical protein RLZ98_3118, partial [Pseudomonadota bacterium]